MHFSTTITTFSLLHAIAAQTTSSKRGLIYIDSTHAADNSIFDSSSSDLTWYYNYATTPESTFSSTTQSAFEYVPMLWGTPSSTTDTSFSDNVKALISGGRNISHVLGFNEPDGTTSTGGSNIDASLAASTWIRELEPLRELGIKLGAPAVTSAQTGFTWLSAFFNACNGNCTVDFIPIHYYGDFQGLADHIGQVRAAYPNQTIWVTEYALANADLADTQSFFNESMDYFDRLDYIDRYSYFGSFRSDTSNVGANVAMLNSKGKLTDIGSWYLGGKKTGVKPNAAGRLEAGLASVLFVMGLFAVL